MQRQLSYVVYRKRQSKCLRCLRLFILPESERIWWIDISHGDRKRDKSQENVEFLVMLRPIRVPRNKIKEKSSDL